MEGAKIGPFALFLGTVSQSGLYDLLIDVFGIETANALLDVAMFYNLAERVELEWNQRYLDGRIVFSPADPVTFAEASVMLNNTVGITDVYAGDNEPAAPAWAAQAVSNLSSCGILSPEAPLSTPATLTRADAAKMITAAMRVIAERGEDSLLKWAK